MTRYKQTFKFFDTEDQARDFTDSINKVANYYARKNHPATYTSWQNADKTENKFVAWYSYK